jgi:hypothetical protein
VHKLRGNSILLNSNQRFFSHINNGGNEKLSITIAPLEVTPSREFDLYSGLNEKDQDLTDRNMPVRYWGIYLDDEAISYTSNKEHAEKTKEWMEKWLRSKN